MVYLTHKNTLIGLAILISTAFLVWTSILSYHTHGNILSSAASLPDAFMEDVIAITLDKQGKPTMKIEAPKMTHYAENDTTQLISPHLTIYRKSPQPWYVSSEHATATEGANKVYFWGDVIIHHPADSGSPATIIKTPTLTVFPDDQIAETIDAVSLNQPSMLVTSVGMHADMNSGEIQLLSQAKGEYVPGA